MAVNIFDANFYRAANPDLRSLNDAQAWSHFQTFGLNEGRTFSSFVNLSFYRSSNSDLLGLSNRQLFAHLQNNGVREGRSFSSFIDLDFYRNSNSDLRAFNTEQLFDHLRNFGIRENRRFSPFVDLKFYIASNVDLAGFNNSQALQHLEIYGVSEGRSFSQFFDINYYRANNLDLVNVGLNTRQLLEHFEMHGLDEGRKFSAAFNVNYYRSVNSDLASAGLKNQQLYEHFQLSGLAEGRASSQQFNVSYYLNNNPDLIAAGLNNWQAYQHFVIYGQHEGRISIAPTPISNSTFNIQFDYRFDTNGFFSDPTRRNALEAAATIWENLIKDEFTNIPVGTNFHVRNPQTNTTVSFSSNYEVDDLVVFVGAMNMGGSSGTLATGGSSATYNQGSSLETRYTSYDNFEPWTGYISFNNSMSWFFDATPNTSDDIPIANIDFLSVAIHELGHVLGIGASAAFSHLVSGSFFYGNHAKALNGNNPIPLDGVDEHAGHVQEGFSIGGVGIETVMDPLIIAGVRKLPTALDVALLADIGYQV